MTESNALSKIEGLLTKLGAIERRIAANGPTVGTVLKQAMSPVANQQQRRDAVTLAGMALDNIEKTPANALMEAEARKLLSALG